VPVLINVICVCLRIVMSNTYCVVFLFCLSSSCVLYVASFSRLSILWWPLRYSLTFIYNRHYDLGNSYGIYVSQMTTDMVRLSQLNTTPSSFITRSPDFEHERLTLPEYLSSLCFYVCVCLVLLNLCVSV